MMLKVVAEVLIGSLLLWNAYVFWSYSKLPGLLGKDLRSESRVRDVSKTVHGLLRGASLEGSLESSAHRQILLDNFKERLDEWKKQRYARVLACFVFASLSLFLGTGYILCDVLLFLCAGFLPIQKRARDAEEGLLIFLSLRLTKWSDQYPEECKSFCTSAKRGIFEKLHSAIYVDLSAFET